MSTEKFGTKSEVRFNVRIPADLHEAVTDRARLHGRSMNAEIARILADVVKPATETERELRAARQVLEVLHTEAKHRLVRYEELIAQNDALLKSFEAGTESE